jgi:asparagine synthase (glutamine-hydrolysing)
MCGIAGEFRFDGGAPDAAPMARMLAKLTRRGPDGEGQFAEGAVRLGHRRLAIIDLSPRSAQPMVDAATGTALVFNGTIYNYPELRAELIALGHVFHSDGDTEVILRAFMQWGEACVERLHGMFAFAIWNRETLFLARDRLGIKPLYYSETGERFRFASTPQALLAAGGLDTSIDAVALHHLFTLHAVVPAPRTLYNGVRKLAPGTTLTVNARGELRHRRYWSLHAQRPATSKTEAEWHEAIHERLHQAVKKRIEIADVKVGVLLSGGLDSSLLVALLAEQGVPDLMTFSVGFEDQPEERGNEFEYSDPVAAMYGTRHHKYLIPNSEVLRRLPEAVDAMSEPMFAQDAVAFYLLAEQVSKTVKVVQSGQGADEIFGGYHWYPHMMRANDAVTEYARVYFDRDHDEMRETLAPQLMNGDYSRDFVEDFFARARSTRPIDQTLQLDTQIMLVDDPVKRVDNMTMAWGLEARVPFLDHELVELAARIPAELKVRDDGKYILKEAARKVVPAEVIDRPKGYFPVPALKYLRGPFLEFVRDILHAPQARARGLFKCDYVDRLLADPEGSLTPKGHSKLWQIAVLESWLQTHGVQA